MALIIYGHPRSRTNLLCSHIEGFPTEIFDLRKVDENLELNWSGRYNVAESHYSGRADRYLQKISSSPPQVFKLFGFHLHNWPQCYSLIEALKYPVIRVHRLNRLDAIISLLIGDKRGWTSSTQTSISPFEVSLRQFVNAFNIVVTQDLQWENKFTPACVLEYNEVPAAIKDGHLAKFGVNKDQLHRMESQDSLAAAPHLIKNFKDLAVWNELMYREKF